MSAHTSCLPPIAVPCGPHGSLFVACSTLISISVKLRAYCLVGLAMPITADVCLLFRSDHALSTLPVHASYASYAVKLDHRSVDD